MKKIILLAVVSLVSAGCSSVKFSDDQKSFAAHSVCEERFGSGVKATYYYYTGESAATAIGIHCGNDPYKQDRIKISRTEWDSKLTNQ